MDSRLWRRPGIQCVAWRYKLSGFHLPGHIDDDDPLLRPQPEVRRGDHVPHVLDEEDVKIVKRKMVKTMLAVFASLEDAGNVVSAIVAAGLVPATLEMIDGQTINAVEDALACGYPRDAGAILLIELDGLRDGMDELAEQITNRSESYGPDSLLHHKLSK
jgi:hypothetical protein